MDGKSFRKYRFCRMNIIRFLKDGHLIVLFLFFLKFRLPIQHDLFPFANMRSRSQIRQTTRATFRIHTIRQPVAIYVATEKETVQIIPFQCAYNGRKSNTYLIIRQCRLRDKISPVTIAYHVQPDSIPVRELLPGLLAVQISRNRYPGTDTGSKHKRLAIQGKPQLLGLIHGTS